MIEVRNPFRYLLKDAFAGMFRIFLGAELFKKPPSRSTVIIPMYHHVASKGAATRFERGIPADLFEEQLRILLTIALPLPAEKLAACLDGLLEPRYYFLPTFDDAFIDVYQTAAPVMERLGLQGIMFVPTGFIDRSVYPWEHALRRTLSVSTGCGGSRLTDGAIERIIAAGWILPEERREFWLRSFPRDESAYDLFATWEDIRRWRDVLVPASHTVSHPRLDLCDAARIGAECAASARVIEANTGVRPWAFAPPFGRSTKCSEEIAARFYTVQFGDANGVTVSGKTNAFLLKRIGPRPDAAGNGYLLSRIAWYCLKERLRR